MQKKYDICGIGNAIVDLLVEIDDSLIKELNLTKGRSHLIDDQKSKEILEKIKYAQMSIIPGGSAAGAVTTIALLGGKTSFFAQIGDDEYGDLFAKETQATLKKVAGMTGHAIVLITPDAERTFAVNLGVSNKFTQDDINEEEIRDSDIFHIEGYLVEQAKPVALHAIKLAKKHGTKVSLDASDPGVIERHKEDFNDIIQNYTTILFANEKEAKVLTGKEPDEALKELANFCETVVIKLGDKGSLIWDKGKTIKVPAVKTTAIDTTGAGDMYAGGFLYGMTRNWSLEECGQLASALASKVVGKIGARLTKEEINEMR